MRDYYPLISSMVAGLDSNTGEARRALYGRARSTLCDQLRRIEPALTNSQMTTERLSLEAAIRKFEAEAIRKARDLPVSVATGARTAREIETGPLEGSPPTEPRQLLPDIQQHGRRASQREKLVELAVLAQVVEAREPKVRKPRAIERPGESAKLLDVPHQHRAMAKQEISAPPALPQAGAAQDLLTKLIEAQQGRAPGGNARPGKRSLPDVPGTADFTTPLLVVLYFVLGFAQLVAFFHGLQTGFGFGGVASIGIFVLLYLTGSLGSIPMAIVSFYGAWSGWQWPIWAAGLLAFPFVILSFAFLGIGGFYSFFSKQKISPLVRVIGPLLMSPRWRERARRLRAGFVQFLWDYPGAAGGRPRRSRRR